MLHQHPATDGRRIVFLFVVIEIDPCGRAQYVEDSLQVVIGFRENLLFRRALLRRMNKWIPREMDQFSSDIGRREYIVDCAARYCAARHAEMLRCRFVLSESQSAFLLIALTPWLPSEAFPDITIAMARGPCARAGDSKNESIGR